MNLLPHTNQLSVTSNQKTNELDLNEKWHSESQDRSLSTLWGYLSNVSQLVLVLVLKFYRSF